MLVHYANLRQFMRITMGVLMRSASNVKKSVNVSLSPDILSQARELNLNLSAVLTEALIEKFREINVMNGCMRIRNPLMPLISG